MKRENLSFEYMVYYHICGLYTLLAYGGVDFFQSRSIVETAHAIFFSSIFSSQKCGFTYTRFHALMLSPIMVFYVLEKTGVSNIFCCFHVYPHCYSIKKIFLKTQMW